MKAIPQTKLAALEGGAVEYALAGTGPAIVLLNGAGGPIEGWFRVFAGLIELGTVLAYNRAGIGRSAKPALAQTGSEVVATLRALLAALALRPPYVLVGHSMGGLHANLFARLYPEDVASVVLLEASAPEDIALMEGGKTRTQRVVERVLDMMFGKDQHGEPAQAANTAAELAASGPFPHVPLVVVTGGRPAMGWVTPRPLLEGRAANQRALARLSPLGHQVIAARSGHFPQFSEPAVMIAAVRAVVSERGPGS